ncbi:hypothetical protein [Actinomadura sp. KC216]|nr:hypothetical protein [Actinomadura sp. KC216]
MSDDSAVGLGAMGRAQVPSTSAGRPDGRTAGRPDGRTQPSSRPWCE